MYRCRTIKTNKTTPRSLKTKNCQHRSEERQYCWNCNSRISPRCGRRLSRHLARSVSVPPTRNAHKSVPCFIRSKSMPYREKDTAKMPANFESSSIKTCFSLSSLHPSTVNVEGEQQAAQRPYNSLTKKIKKNETPNQESWRGDSSYEFLSSLRTSYQYLMDNNLIESCKEVGCDLNNASPIQDWNVERLNIYIKELEKSFCSGSASKPDSCNSTENLSSPKRLSLNGEVCRLNILRHIAQLSKRLPHCREPSLSQSRSSIYNAHYLEVKSNLRSLDQWTAQMEVRLKPNYFRVNWNRREIRQKAEEHKSIHSEIESKGKCIRLVLKYCTFLAEEPHQPTTLVHQELVQTVPLLTKKAKNFEHRWQLLYIRSLEWICFIESLTVKKCRKDSNSSSDCDEEPVHKCPRLVDHNSSNSSNGKQDNSEMETETSPSPVLQSERMSFDDTANFHRSDRKGPNLATFYYRHLDTDSEQESQKKSIAETEVKTSESSEEEEWTYSANATKEVKKPDVPVSLAEPANVEEIKALVDNVNWSVSKNKHSEKLWMSGNGVKRRIFRHETVDPDNEDFIGDSCDASGEYTTEDDDQHFNSDNHSHSSRSCDITVMQTQELDFSPSPGNMNYCSSPKVVLRSKPNTGNSLRPVSMSGLPQSSPKTRLLTESCQLSVSESALNHISHEQVSVNGRDSSTIEESTATQTQDCCASYNTNSLRRRKLKHRRKSTVERKSKSGSADSLSSAVNSVTYNQMITSDSFSGSLSGITQIDSQRVDSETEEEVTKESKRPTVRKRPMKMPVFRLGEFGAVTPREKRFPLTTQLPSGTTTDFSSFSEQAWDSYQEKYLSEPYSEDPPDPESVRRLLDFGDDYRKCFDSQSDCASSIGRPSFLDDETFEQYSSDSVRNLILKSRSHLNYLDQVLSKLVTYPNSKITVTEIGRLKQWCRENEYCLRCYLEGIKDSQTFVSVNDIEEMESMVKRCARLELDISKQEKIQLLKTDIAAIKSRLMSFSRNDRLDDGNLQNKNELHALIHTAKTELLSLDTYWSSRNIVSITEELNRHFNELNNSNTVLNHMNKEVADLYSIYANTRQRLESVISKYQNALITWAEWEKLQMELEMKFKDFGDVGIAVGNQKSGCFGSASDSGLSDSGSEHEINEQEKRLVNLKQLAKTLMTIMAPGCEALKLINARMEDHQKQLDELKQTCNDYIVRTNLCSNDDNLDGSESLIETNISSVGVADVAAEEPIVETIEEPAAEETIAEPVVETTDETSVNNSRMRWIAGTFYLLVVVLCGGISWLEPQCCDQQNNYKWSFALGLRYINGPPPT